MNSTSSKESLRGPLMFLLLAAVLHVLLIPPLMAVLLREDATTNSARQLSVDLWSSEMHHAEERDAQDDNQKRTVVDVDTGQTARSEDQAAKYFSKGGSRAEKQMRAKDLGKPVAAPIAEALTNSTPTLPESLPPNDTPPMASAATDELVLPGESPRPPEVPKLKVAPDEAVFQSAVAGSGLADLRDVLEGEQTALNSMSFRHAPFFNRVQKMVEQYWHPDVAIRRNDPETKIIGSKDRVTTLLVVLNREGVLHKVYTLHPSGALFLDEEASSAVTLAAPFPNVPSGLINSDDGLVKFLFQFTVEIHKKPVIRVRRYD